MQTRNIRCLPDVLVINCEVNSAKEAEFWRAQAEVSGETVGVRLLLSPAVTNAVPPPLLWTPVCLQQSQAEGGRRAPEAQGAGAAAYRVVPRVNALLRPTPVESTGPLSVHTLSGLFSSPTSSGEDMRGSEGITFNTRAEDLRHVWIPLTMKMTISKTQSLEVVNWPEAEEVRRWGDGRERIGSP